MRKALLFTAALSLLLTSPSHAFLSLIRQGAESADIANANDHFGATVCTGDFNGDGLDDLATAAPDESNGLINLAVHGLVTINYGSSRGLSHQNAHSISVGDLGTAAARFGRSLASADFDQDGYDDLAVGIPQLNSIGGTDRGAVWIYRGGASGLQNAPYRQIAYDDVEVAPEDYANFGWALTAGDFNDDTYPDIATSAIGHGSDTGVLYFFYGSNINGITTAGFDKLFPFTVGGSQALGGRFGWSLAAGQLDGQGGDDLVVGAPQTNVAGQSNAGRAYFYYSNASGITGTGGWFIDASNLGATAPVGPAWFGFSVATGHMYQVSGQEDVAIGAPDDQYGIVGKVGAVLLVEFDQVAQGSYNSIRLLRQSAQFNATSAAPGDRFGEAIAVGRFDIGNYEDLAIGAPGEDVLEQFALGTQGNAGIFHILYGRDGGPSIGDSETYTMVDLNNYVDAGENLGASLAFGRFDATSRHGLAVGAPDADYDSYESGGTNINDAGQVHIFAPWRQPTGYPHRSSVALDCSGFIVYAQRPFQRLRPASTTKTLTLALACDAIFDLEVDPQQFFLVPDWVADQVGGSQTPLVEGEQLSFVGLMQTMMTVSGNDSAMLLGAILSGDGGPWEGWTDTSPAFATMMETKASQLGLSGATSMTNAAGIDSGDHYVTALDWARLAYMTIQDDCVKTIVNTSPWIVERIQPAGTSMGFFQAQGEGGSDIHVFEAFVNGYVNGVKGAYPKAIGTKGGKTPGAWRTGLSAGDPFGGGQSAVSSFGTRRDDYPVDGVVDGDLSGLQGSLLAVAETFCDDGIPDDILMPPNVPDPQPWGTLTGIPPCPDAGPRGMTLNFTDPQVVKPGRTVQVDLMRHTVVDPTVPVRMMIGGTQDINIGVGELKEMSISPHESNLGLEIRNVGTTLAVFEVQWGSAITPHTLAPGDLAVIPGVSAPGRSFTGRISSLASTPMSLEVNQVGYTFEGLIEDGIVGPKTLSVQLTRILEVEDEMLSVYVRGMDDDCDDGTLDLVVRANDEIPTAIGDPDGFAPPRPTSFQLHAPAPNPFNPRTVLQFDLPNPATVDLAVYDVRGRRVRTLRSGELYAAGLHRVDWDGTDDQGRSVASGVYLVQLVSGGRQDTRRVTLIK